MPDRQAQRLRVNFRLLHCLRRMSQALAAPKNKNIGTRPFLKWAGGKFRLIERIRGHLPPGKRLVEPFVGSGAVFLNLDYPSYLLADINPDLIGLYRLLQSEGDAFIERARRYFVDANNTPEQYYQLRERFNHGTDPEDKAALFIYLNRHGYNGLCRYNSQGGFNVPFGRYKRIYFPEAEMRVFHQRSQRAEFICADFSDVMKKARKGEVVYCDPPYSPLSETASFTAYASRKFGRAAQFNQEQQEILARLSAKLAKRGIPVLLSNHDNEFTRSAYASAQLTRFPVRRFISCNGQRRENADELLALYA